MAKENTSKKGEARNDPKDEGSKFTLSKIIENDRAATVLSIILAVIVWAVVTISQFPTVSKVFKDVPVVVNIEGTSAEAANLQIVKIENATITVELEGQRAQIGDLKSEDLVAAVNANGVTKIGTSYLPYTIKSDKNVEFTVKNTHPQSVEVEFDKMIEKEIPVRVKADGIVLKKGYFSEEPLVNPDKIVIKGSSKLVESITDAEVTVTLDTELEKTTMITATNVALYSNGAKKEYNQGDITYNKSIDVTIPVYTRKILPLEVTIANAPANLDLDHFKEQLHLSVDQIEVASQDQAALDKLDSINIGTIDMYTVDNQGTVFKFNKEDFLPEGFRDLSDIGSTVTVTCPTENLSKKTIVLTRGDFTFVNYDSKHYTIDPISSGLTFDVVGDAGQISSLTKEDIIAQVDLEGANLKEEEVIKGVVELIINGCDNVWIYNDNGIVKPVIYLQANKFVEDIEETRVE